jgi:hypothetical protein
MKIIYQGNNDEGTVKKGLRSIRSDYHKNPYMLKVLCTDPKCKMGATATGPDKASVFSAMRTRINDARKQKLTFVPEDHLAFMPQGVVMPPIKTLDKSSEIN